MEIVWPDVSDNADIVRVVFIHHGFLPQFFQPSISLNFKTNC